MQRGGKANFHYSHFEQNEGRSHQQRGGSDDVIDGEFVDLDEQGRPKNDNGRLPPR